MRWVVVSCVLLWFAANALYSRSDDQAPDTPTYSLSGTVINSLSGEPIRRALVQILAGQQQPSVLTDDSGKFAFDHLPAGDFQVNVRKPGFATEHEVSGRPPGLARVGPDSEPITLRLVPDGVIIGNIADSDGLPVSQFPVQVFKRRVVGTVNWNIAAMRVTDEDGQFRVGELPPGTYYVGVGPGQGPAVSTRGRPGEPVMFPEVFYPSAPDLTSATPVRVGPAQQVQLDFSISAERCYKISGTITGSEVMNTWVELRKRTGSNNPTMVRVNAEGGTFAANRVLSGSYVLLAHGQNGSELLFAQRALTVHGDMTGVHLALAPAASIPVLVEEHGSKKSEEHSGVVVFTRNEDNSFTMRPSNMVQQQVSVELKPKESWQTPATASVSGIPDNPKFAIENVMPGKYSVQVQPIGSWYIESAMSGSTDLLRDDLEVTGVGVQEPIRIVLRDDGGAISVTIRGSAATNPTILAKPDRGPALILGAMWTAPGPSSKPALTVQNIRPGAYRLMAFERIDNLEYSNNEALEPYLSKGETVTVSAGETATVTLDVIKQAEE